MSESDDMNIMHEATARAYHRWNMGFTPTGVDLARAWVAAPEPEKDIPPEWWVARFQEALPGVKTVNLTHLYRAASGTELRDGFFSMEWTTDREEAEREAHRTLRVLVETVVVPRAVLAVLGDEDGGTVLVDPWMIPTAYVTGDVVEDQFGRLCDEVEESHRSPFRSAAVSPFAARAALRIKR